MRVLALDTASEACSVACLDGSRLIERRATLPRAHVGLILPMVEGVLSEAGLRLGEIDRLAVGRGPGAFTGVRIAISVTQGLAWGAGLPVVAVSDLAAVAHETWRATGQARILVVMDARMGEVYTAAYEFDAAGSPRTLAPERVLAPASLELPPGPWWLAGSGLTAHGAALRARLGADLLGETPDVLPWAAAVAALAVLPAAQPVPADRLAPVYLRDEVAVPTR